jgi:hypothetical protein
MHNETHFSHVYDLSSEMPLLPSLCIVIFEQLRVVLNDHVKRALQLSVQEDVP